jgi:hypothetical protein
VEKVVAVNANALAAITPSFGDVEIFHMLPISIE